MFKFAKAGDAESRFVDGFSVDVIHQHECAICPLDLACGLQHAKMRPGGDKRAQVYLLGEAPGAQEDAEGEPFVGPSGRLLRESLPRSAYRLGLRFNNVVRCRPPSDSGGKQQDPSPLQVEACRPSIARDIELTKPKAILGFGNVALEWVTQERHILRWCGRRFPVKIGQHTCWFFPLMHPAYVLHRQDEYDGRDVAFTFALQLKAAVAEISNGLAAPIVHSETDAHADLELITGSAGARDLERVRARLDQLSAPGIVGHDYETVGIRPYDRGHKLLSVAFAGPEIATAIALDHCESRWGKAERRELQGMLREFLLRRRCRLVSHHLPFELEWSAFHFGPEVLWAAKWGDSESQAYILDERQYTFALDFLCRQYFGLSIKGLSSLDRDTLDEAPLDQVLRYNAVDSKYHRLCYLAQRERLLDEGLIGVYRHQLERTIATTASTIQGLPLDRDTNARLLRQYGSKLERIEDEISHSPEAEEFRARFGRPYRPGSLPDVNKYVHAVLGIAKEKIENLSEATLADLDEPLCRATLKWRRIKKIHSTYVLPLAPGSEHVFDDGCLHPITSTTRTRTWRTSGEDPNMQNWPMHDKVAKKARRQIRPGPTERVVAFDYSGIQARNVAMESRDRKLVDNFWQRYDIHADWCWRILRRVPDWVPGGARALKASKELFGKYRQRAKNELVFPTFFGSKPQAIAFRLGCEERDAIELWEEFGDEYPDIYRWHDKLIRAYRETGYVTGLSGFRRHAPVAYNQLINSPIQADEALIVCGAMVRLAKRGLPCAMEVHDDLTFIWPKQDIDKHAPVVIGEMLKITHDWINVPLQVEMSIGEDWGSMVKTGAFESIGLTNEWREIK